MDIYVRNDFGALIQYLWVDYEGREQPYGVLDPGEDGTWATYAGHVWRFRENTPGTPLVYEIEVTKTADAFNVPRCRLHDSTTPTPHFPHGPYPFISQLLVVLLIWYFKWYKKKAAIDDLENEESL